MTVKNYSVRANGHEHGTVYTQSIIVDYILDCVGYSANTNLSKIKIIDPAAGEGAFVYPILERLYQSSKVFKFSFKDALKNIYAIELDLEVSDRLNEGIRHWLRGTELEFDSADVNTVINDDYLLHDFNGTLFDIVIGNPPYIRYDEIPAVSRDKYKALFHTFRHRSDIYIGFYEKSLRLLKENGILGFICSNRWMKTKYGELMRQLIANEFSLVKIIDINANDAFDQVVDAYASITIVRNVRSTTDVYQFGKVTSLDQLKMPDELQLAMYAHPTNQIWQIGAEPTYKIPLGYEGIEKQGYKIGIGIATGADSVFVTRNPTVEDELTVPLILGRDISGGIANWSGTYLVSPYDKCGDLIDLEKYPLAKVYFESFREKLSERHIARKNTVRNWYRTIDRLNPDLKDSPKLLIPDMKGDGLFPVDEGKYYPHHNVYYITGGSVRNLKILAAILMSDFSREQIDLVSVKMRGGYARWQSQNLRKILLPNLTTISKKDSEILIAAYEEKDIVRVNAVVNALVVSTQG